MGVDEVKIPKFYFETAFSKQGYFLHFSSSRANFVNRSYLPNFCVLKASARSECGNEIPFSQKSCFTIKNMHNLPNYNLKSKGRFSFH